MFAERKQRWLAQLTHVCLSSNSLREVPAALLEGATSLVELDLAYNHNLQVRAFLSRALLLQSCKCRWDGSHGVGQEAAPR